MLQQCRKHYSAGIYASKFSCWQIFSHELLPEAGTCTYQSYIASHLTNTCHLSPFSPFSLSDIFRLSLISAIVANLWHHDLRWLLITTLPYSTWWMRLQCSLQPPPFHIPALKYLHGVELSSQNVSFWLLHVPVPCWYRMLSVILYSKQ